MKAVALVLVLAVLYPLSGYAADRTISGRLIYRDSGVPARQITLLLNFPKKYPGFFVYFVFPRRDTYDGKVITDNKGQFLINTKENGPLIIQPVVPKNLDVVATELTDTIPSISSDGKATPNVIIRRSQVKP